jgi:hypothetical protein
MPSLERISDRDLASSVEAKQLDEGMADTLLWISTTKVPRFSGKSLSRS